MTRGFWDVGSRDVLIVASMRSGAPDVIRDTRVFKPGMRRKWE
jgi:hypothetical protein